MPERWAYRRLAVNYRTPADIMDVATVLAEVDPPQGPPTSVRRTDVPPWARAAPPRSGRVRVWWR